MNASLATTKVQPRCETLPSFLSGNEGVFIAQEALIRSIAVLLSHASVAPDLILEVNKFLNEDPFTKKSAPIDVRDSETCRTLSSALLRFALGELASDVPEEVSQKILGQLKADLANQNAREARTTRARYASLTLATCLVPAAIGFLPREENEQQPPPNLSGESMSGHLARALYEQLAPPQEPEQNIAPNYMYDRKTRELLFKTADPRIIFDAQSNSASYEVTLEGGATARFTGGQAFALTHEACGWIEGPVLVHDRDTGELLYRGDLGALGFTLTNFDPCLSLYVPDTEKGSSRTNVIEGVVLDRVVVSSPSGVIDIAESLKDFILD